jgi:hypothetical protein
MKRKLISIQFSHFNILKFIVYLHLFEALFTIYLSNLTCILFCVTNWAYYFLRNLILIYGFFASDSWNSMRISMKWSLCEFSIQLQIETFLRRIFFLKSCKFRRRLIVNIHCKERKTWNFEMILQFLTLCFEVH